MDVLDNINPDRFRPEIEWSVSMTSTRVSSDRFVIYGLEQSANLAFLEAHGVNGRDVMGELLATYGAPSQVAVGRDGERAKLYWFLPSRQPYFVGADFVDGAPLQPKVYTEYQPTEGKALLERIDGRVRPHVAWLLERSELSSAKLFHLVAFRRSPSQDYAGVHVGLKPDWRALLAREPALLHTPLVREFVAHLGFDAHWETIEARALTAPMAWTCYLSVQARPSGDIGMTVYSRASPVVLLDDGLALVEPGEDGTYPRPVVVTCEHESIPNVRLRFRFQGPPRSFVRANGWLIDYGPLEGDHKTLPQEQLELVESIARKVCYQAGPMQPVRLAEELESLSGIEGVAVGPDLRREN